MLSMPRPLCVRFGLNSSLKTSPQTDLPPKPVPSGSPPCTWVHNHAFRYSNKEKWLDTCTNYSNENSAGNCTSLSLCAVSPSEGHCGLHNDQFRLDDGVLYKFSFYLLTYLLTYILKRSVTPTTDSKIKIDLPSMHWQCQRCITKASKTSSSSTPHAFPKHERFGSRGIK